MEHFERHRLIDENHRGLRYLLSMLLNIKEYVGGYYNYVNSVPKPGDVDAWYLIKVLFLLSCYLNNHTNKM